MPNLVCDKCGKHYSEDKSTSKQKCVCGGNLHIINPENIKKESQLGNEPKRLKSITSRNYIPLIMIFMIVLAGVLIFMAASSVFDPASLYDVKCPYCGSQNVKLIDSDVMDESLSFSRSFDVYACLNCKKQFYYDKEGSESIKK